MDFSCVVKVFFHTIVEKCSTKFYLGEDVVSFKTKIIRFGINPFLGLMPNFVGLLEMGQFTQKLGGLQFWLS
jgi:hypothetical protein